ncbi:MAG: hypothetical protein AAF944_00315 [Bacteroidota bacterium]
MTFLFVAGVEGAGHDMLRALLKNVFEQPTFVLEGAWRKTLINYWDIRVRYNQEFGFFKRDTRTAARDTLQTLVNQCQKEGITHLFEDISYPFYQPRNSMRRTDLLDFTSLLPNDVQLKVLVLYRNPVSATYSGIRRKFTKNVYEQARIVEDNLIYIDRHVTVGLNGNFRSLIFEDFLREPRAFLVGLADWLEVDELLLEKGLPNLREPFAAKDIPTKTRDILTAFFTPERARLWANLYAPAHQIRRNPN